MKKLIIVLLIMMMPVIIYATSTGTFLNMSASARESALGGAMAAVNQEMDAVSFNPAGLSRFEGFGASVLYNKQLFGNSYGNVNVANSIPNLGIVGVSFRFLSVSFDNVFDNSVSGGSQNLSDISIGLAFQRDITENLSAGIGAKFISMDLGGVKSGSVGADVGLLYQISTKRGTILNIGAGVRNIGLGMKFENKSEQLPMTIISGIMYQPISLVTIYGELDKPMSMGIEYGGGLEFSLYNLLKPRIGYRGGNGKGDITAGLNIKSKIGNTTFGIDYAMGIGLELTHIIELKAELPALF